MTKPVRFDKLKHGDRFEHEGEAWKKIDAPLLINGQLAELHNAMMLRLRQTAFFASSLLVMPLRPLKLVFWRRWLLTRSLRWQLAGFVRWARWSWKAARFLATERTHQALAAHATQLIVMGE